MGHEQWLCNRHNTLNSEGDACPACLDWFAKMPDPADMTPDERVAELELHWGQMTVPFNMIHERIEALAGCPVWTHQIVMKDWLRETVRERGLATNDGQQALDHLKEMKPDAQIIAIEATDGH